MHGFVQDDRKASECRTCRAAIFPSRPRKRGRATFLNGAWAAGGFARLTEAGLQAPCAPLLCWSRVFSGGPAVLGGAQPGLSAPEPRLYPAGSAVFERYQEYRAGPPSRRAGETATSSAPAGSAGLSRSAAARTVWCKDLGKCFCVHSFSFILCHVKHTPWQGLLLLLQIPFGLQWFRTSAHL